MLHVRIDEKLRTDAAESLAKVGLSISHAVRIFLTRVSQEGGLPASLTMDPEAHGRLHSCSARAYSAGAGCEPAFSAAPSFARPSHLVTKTKKAGTKNTARTVAEIIPPRTPMPMAF